MGKGENSRKLHLLHVTFHSPAHFPRTQHRVQTIFGSTPHATTTLTPVLKPLPGRLQLRWSDVPQGVVALWSLGRELCDRERLLDAQRESFAHTALVSHNVYGKIV